jgi:hypothetical protein
MSADAGGIISADDLNRLVDLFLQFEGASDPLALPCKEAEEQFDGLVERIYAEQVAPKFQSITLLCFRSGVRKYCRLRLASEGPPHPCV